MLQFYRNYRQMIDACDEEIERHLQEIDARNDSDDSPHPPTKRYQLQGTGSDSNFDLKTHLCRLLGTDLTQIDGISDLTTHIFFTEVGPDLSLFKTASHFCSWLGLCRTNNLLFMLKNHL